MRFMRKWFMKILYFICKKYAESCYTKKGEMHMEKNILVYNNGAGIVEAMDALCISEEIRMFIASCVDRIWEFLRREEIHLLLLDVEPERMGWSNSIELIRHIRRETAIPMIIISNQNDETAKIMALNAGADDYVEASCNPLELLARVKSQIRRYTQLVNVCAGPDRVYRIDGLEVNDKSRTVRVDGKEVRLTPIEYKILRLLVQERGKVLSISQIYEAIWHMQAIGVDNTIAVHIRHIREKIENNPKDPRYLKVVWGNGYKVG